MFSEGYIAFIAGIVIFASVVGLVWFGIEWHHYGFKNAVIISFILGPLTSLTSLLGAIPIAGPFLYWWLYKGLVYNNFFQWFSIEPSWITAFYLWSGLIVAVSHTIGACSRIFGGLSTDPQHRYDPYA